MNIIRLMKIATLISRLQNGKDLWYYEAGFEVCVSKYDANNKPICFEIKTPSQKIYIYTDEERNLLDIFTSINEGKEESHYLLGAQHFDDCDN